MRKELLSDIKIIEPKIFADDRGSFSENFNLLRFRELININYSFVQDNKSLSKKGVFRGLHYQLKNPQGKLVQVTAGEVFDVVVDLRKNSKTFGKCVQVVISDKDDFSFYIPKNFAHGFLCLSKDCTVNYKCSEYRNEKSETTINWSDKDINIKWPIKKPILSKKDANGISLIDFKKKLK